MRVIAFTGPKRSGKNTTAALALRFAAGAGAPTREVAFADPIRAAAEAAGLPPESLREGKDAPLDLLGGRPGRDFLIMLGMGARGLRASFWIEAARRRLDAIEDAHPGATVAITDMRFGNELDALERWACCGKADRSLAAAWIERPGAPQDEVLDYSLRDRCRVVENAGGIADLAPAAWSLALPGRPAPVIVESPFAGDVARNVGYARAAVRDSVLRGEAPIASHLLFTQPGILRDEVAEERALGIAAGLAWRPAAAWSAFYVDRGWSRGMLAAREAAQRAGAPYVIRAIAEGAGWEREAEPFPTPVHAELRKGA